MKNKIVNKKLIYNLLIILFILFAGGCKCYAQDSAPYLLNGEFVMEEDVDEYSICGIKIFLLNKSEKNICKANLAFFLFDKDGEPALECRNKLEFCVEENLSASESCDFCIALDKYMNSIPTENLFVDYLYLSKIEYEDGSVWEDPFGLLAFK